MQQRAHRPAGFDQGGLGTQGQVARYDQSGHCRDAQPSGLLAEGGPPSLLVALADLDTIERTMAWAQRLHGAACHLLAALPLPCDIADPKVAAAVEALRVAVGER